jgi:endonuclease YncB( thermonuclease family)
VHLDVDLGLNVMLRDCGWPRGIRLYGLNAPELTTARGKVAKQWLEDALPRTRWAITLRTHLDRHDKYGGILGVLWVGRTNINDAMIEAGHAVPYMLSGEARG